MKFNQISKSLFLCLLPLVAVGHATGQTLQTKIARAPILQFDSGSQQVDLYELYTSESCSSCPTADKKLSRLKEHPELWKKFVPISFHVDYWNYLSWVDPFSESQFSQRQRGLAGLWKNPRVYTPGLIRNGLEHRDWRSFERSKSIPSTYGRLIVNRIKPNTYKVKFLTKKLERNWVVHGVPMLMGVERHIKSGENSGLKTAYDFIGCALSSVPLKESKMDPTSKLRVFETILNLDSCPSKIPLLGQHTGSKMSGHKQKMQSTANLRQAAGFWVSEGGSLVPRQATGGFL